MPPFRENSDIISSQDSDTHSLRKRDNSLQRKPKYSPHLDQNSQQITETSLYPGLAIHSEIVNQSKIVFAEQMKGKERTIPQGEPSGNVKDPPNKILARPLMGSNQSKLNYSPEKQDIRHHEALESAGQAMAFCRLEKYNEALTAANRAVTLHNDRASHHCLKARILYMLEEFDKALESTNQAIILDKNDASSHCIKSQILLVYGKHEKYDEALESANQAIILDKDNASSHYVKSKILCKYGKYDKALESINRSREIDPYNTLYLFHKINVECLIKENSPESISSHILPNTNLSPEIQHSTELIYKTPDLKITSSTRETTQIREAVQNSARDLATIIENHESYQGFPTKEEAILMLCGYDGKKKLDELNRDDWLYLEGTLNGMKYVLERYKNQPNEKLTGKYLVEIQKHFLPKEYIKGSIGNITEMTGFRNQDTSFAIGPDGWIGYQEWKKQCDKWNKDSNHKLYQMFMTEDEVKAGNVMNTVDYNNQAVAVVVNHKREEPQLNEAGDCFFEECDNDIQEASNTNEEVHIRGRTLGWLGKGQLLNDANSRAAAYGIAFKWVLEN